jgi:integrase
MKAHRKPGRPAKGTVVRLKSGPHAGQLQGIITLADGSRKRLPPFPPGTSEAMAEERTLTKAREALDLDARKATPAGVPAKGGGAEWWERYLAHREARGLSPVMHMYRPHIAPVLGDKHPRDWTREDCERLVTELDKKIAAGASWKTVANVWSLFTKACKVASSAKAGTELRVRSDNPCAGVEGPDRGEKKAKQWLYPSEFEQLVTCDTVPLRWRRLYALLAYTYVRPGELRALTWADVDRQVGTIRVSKAWDEKLGRLKPPKTRAGVRYVPIEPTLDPLLEALSEGAQAGDLVVSRFPPMEDWAAKFRRYLQRAGVMRAELFADTETHKQITLYDLRATGITWRCLREDYGSQIQEAAGHEKFDTTNGYIRTARVFVGGWAIRFPRYPRHSSREFRSRVSIREGLTPRYLCDPSGN